MFATRIGQSALVPALLGTGLVLAQGLCVAQGGPDEAALRQRALVSPGDLTRLARVLEKAAAGEAVTLGVIGGSITAGASASREEFRYGNRIAAWLRETYPGTEVTLVNAGIGATGSNYGALRAERDLLSRRPDLVVVEYGANDPNFSSAAETLEGLVRQILSQPNEPAVVLLFMMAQGDPAPTNAQEWHGKVGAHYGLPMLSFRDALWPEIQAGRLAWEDVMADVVHPNDRGHGYAASFVTDLIEAVRTGALPSDPTAEVAPLPAPLLSNLFEHVALYEADALTPTRNDGWTYDGADQCWRADQPGSVVEFELMGSVVLDMVYRVRGPMGMVRIEVDDRPPVVRDSWFDQDWGSWRGTTETARDLGPGPHRVRLTLLAEKHPESTGTEFRLLGLGAGGVTDR